MSSCPSMLCLRSVLNVPLDGSKTSSEEKLGPTGLGCWDDLASSWAAKVMAGLFRVKLSTSESKSKELGAAGVGAGASGRRVG